MSPNSLRLKTQQPLASAIASALCHSAIASGTCATSLEDNLKPTDPDQDQARALRCNGQERPLLIPLPSLVPCLGWCPSSFCHRAHLTRNTLPRLRVRCAASSPKPSFDIPNLCPVHNPVDNPQMCGMDCPLVGSLFCPVQKFARLNFVSRHAPLKERRARATSIHVQSLGAFGGRVEGLRGPLRSVRLRSPYNENAVYFGVVAFCHTWVGVERALSIVHPLLSLPASVVLPLSC